MAEQIVLEFIASTEQLKGASTELKNLAKISKELYADFTKMNQAYEQGAKKAADAQKLLGKTLQDTGKDVKDMSDQFRQLDTLLTGEGLKQATGMLLQMSKEIQALAEYSKTLNAELEQTRKTLEELAEAGEQNSARFKQMSAAAAELETKIKSTAGSMAAFQAGKEVLEGVKEVFEAASGTLGLFGERNATVEKSITKLNSVLAVAENLEKLHALATKESTAAMLIANGQRSLAVVATNLQSAAESKNIIVRNGATVAQWALNAAMAANPVLLLVGGIAALAAGLYFLVESSESATEAQKKLNEQQQILLEGMQKKDELLRAQSDAEINQSENALKQLKAQGATTAELREAEAKLDRQRETAAGKRKSALEAETYFQKNSLKEFETNSQAFYDQLGELESRIEQMKQALNRGGSFDGFRGDDLKEQIEIAEEGFTNLNTKVKLYSDVVTGVSEATTNAVVKDLEREKQAREETLTAAIAGYRLQVAQAKEGTQAELDAKIAAIRKEAELRKSQLPQDSSKGAQAALLDIEARKKIIELQQQQDVQALRNAKANIDAKLLDARKGSEEELNIKLEAVQAQEKADLAAVKSTKYTEDEKKRIIAQSVADQKQLQSDFDSKHQQAQANTDIAYLKTKIATSLELSEEHLNAQLDFIDAEAEAQIVARTKDIEGTKEAAAIIAQIEAEAASQKLQLQLTTAQAMGDLRNSETSAEIAHIKALADLAANNPNASPAVKKKAMQDYLQAKIAADQKEIESENQKYEKQKEALQGNHAAIEKLEKDHTQKLVELNDKKNADVQEADAQATKQKEELAKQIFDLTIEAAREITGAVFQIQAENRKAQLDEDLAKLNEQKEKELSNKNLTEEQKDAINKKYAKKEAELKLKAWESDKQAKLLQAVINTALSVTSALGSAPPPANFIAAAAAGIAGAVQIGIIASQKPPKFAKGTKGSALTPPGFKWVGEEGPELMYTPGHEKIITNTDSMKLLQLYNIPVAPALNNIPKEIVQLKDIATGLAMPAIDYNRLGDILAEKLRNNPQTHIRIDKGGYSLHVLQKGRAVELLNNKYEA